MEFDIDDVESDPAEREAELARLRREDPVHWDAKRGSAWAQTSPAWRSKWWSAACSSASRTSASPPAPAPREGRNPILATLDELPVEFTPRG